MFGIGYLNLNLTTDQFMKKYNYIYEIPLLIYPYIVFNYKPKRKYDMKIVSRFWNFFQFIFSFYTIYNILNNFTIIYDKNFNEKICERYGDDKIDKYSYSKYIIGYGISKIWDMGDTIILLMQQKDVKFIHWYHHWNTLFLIYTTKYDRLGLYVTSLLINSFIHTIMYLYFFINTFTKLNGCKILTKIQIIQMFIGVYLMLHNFIVCKEDTFEHVGFILYAIYIKIFIDFGKQRYVKQD